MGVARPRAQGQAMISTLTARDQRIGQTRLRPDHRPDDEGRDRRQHHGGHEPGGDAVGQPLDRRAAALGLSHQGGDLVQQGVGSDLLGLHHEAAGGVQRARDQIVADLLRHRQGFTGDERLVQRCPAFDQAAIDRDFLARPHAQAVAHGNVFDGDLLVRSVQPDAQGLFWRQVQQGSDGAGGTFAGAQLQQLAQEHQGDDDGGGLEIEGRLAVHVLEGVGDQVGRDDRGRAETPGDQGPERDQGEHVQVPSPDRGPAARDERPARPQHHRRRQGELDPSAPAVG